jgi:cyclopropane-fatty-acyl-phospholipid synthase
MTFFVTHGQGVVVMRVVLDLLLQRLITVGTLRLRWPDGNVSVYQGTAGPDITCAMHDWPTVRRFITSPSLALGEGYMHGNVTVENAGIYDLLDLLLTNIGDEHNFQPLLALQNWRIRLLRRLHQWNWAARSQRNVAHHYDLSENLYRFFLDRDMQYSCAYFPTGQETLEEAQAAKKAHIAKKLRLAGSGMRVLDIGCGWGGMALTLARDYGAEVLGITLSREQLEVARSRAHEAGLDGRVRFELRDYRDVGETFDRIVSVGMFEHVGVGHYGQYFDAVRNCLAPDGVALLHSIGRLHGPFATDPWLTKYIFPGGYAPALSEVLPVVERSGLIVTDIEVLRLHYAQTLRHWRTRFEAHRNEIKAEYDETFCRMFEFYLAGSELAFRRCGQMIWQMQMARAIDTVPLTRDYMATPPAVGQKADNVFGETEA